MMAVARRGRGKPWSKTTNSNTTRRKIDLLEVVLNSLTGSGKNELLQDSLDWYRICATFMTDSLGFNGKR